MKPPHLYAPNAVAPAVEMITGFLESRIEEGAHFLSGQTIQCSWMWFTVGEDEKGRSVVLAPRTGAMPMDFVPDCSEALNLVLTQRYVCDSFGVEPGWCSAMQSAIVIKDFSECREVFMNRTDPEDGHSSGWYLGAFDSKLDVNDAENLQLMSLWELSCHFPLSRDFYLLPPGWQVVFDQPPTVLRDFERAVPEAGSYCARKYES